MVVLVAASATLMVIELIRRVTVVREPQRDICGTASAESILFLLACMFFSAAWLGLGLG